MPTPDRRAFLLLGAAAWATISSGRAKAAPTRMTEVNVKDFGATGDGTTDDTAAIHAGRDAIGVGGKIVIPSGTYMVSGLTASVENQVWELADDAVIRMKIGAASVLDITGAGVSVTGGVFDAANGTAHDGSQHGIKILGADGVSIVKVTAKNSPYIGIAAYNVNNLIVAQCTLTNNYSGSIWCRNGLLGPSNLYGITFTDNTVDESASISQFASGIGIYGNKSNERINRVVVSGNNIVLPYRQTSGVTGAVGLANCTDFVIENNICVGGFISISCPNAIRGTIADNLVRGFSYVGVELPIEDAQRGPGEVNNVAIFRNVLDPDGVSASAGIQTSAFGPSATGSISNLSIIANTIQNFVDSCNLINFGSGSQCSRISIVGNTLTSAVPSGQFNAVAFNGDITGLAMSQNSVDGSSTENSRGVLFLGGALGVSITGNQFSNLSGAVVEIGSYSSSDKVDEINVVGNAVVNCGTKLKNSATNGAVVGTNISPLPG